MTTPHSSNEPAKPASSPSSGPGRTQKPGLLYDLNRETQTPYKSPGVSGGKLTGEVTDRAGNGSQDRKPGPRQHS